MLNVAHSFDLYSRLPIPIQNLACCWYGWRESQIRFGRSFHQRLASLCQSEWWSANEIEAFQNAALRKLIHHAYEHVPYYRDLMCSLRLHPDDIRCRQDLPKLPILTK